MLKLKLQYFGHLIRRVDSLVKTLILGGIGGRRRRGQQRMRWLDGHIDSMDVSLSNSNSWWWTQRPGVLQFMGSQRVGHDWATELNWNVTLIIKYRNYFAVWKHTYKRLPKGSCVTSPLCAVVLPSSIGTSFSGSKTATVPLTLSLCGGEMNKIFFF